MAFRPWPFPAYRTRCPKGSRWSTSASPWSGSYGHIEGAIHIPLGELPDRLDEVPEGQTLVVCKVGARSAQAVGWLAQQGRDVVNLDGGLLDWEAAGRALVSETGQPPQVV